MSTTTANRVAQLITWVRGVGLAEASVAHVNTCTYMTCYMRTMHERWAKHAAVVVHPWAGLQRRASPCSSGPGVPDDIAIERFSHHCRFSV